MGLSSSLQKQNRGWISTKLIAQLSLNSETFCSSLSSFDDRSCNPFGMLSRLPLDIINLILEWMLFSTTTYPNRSNIKLVSKSFYISCDILCKTKCVELFCQYNVKKFEESNVLFFKNRWNIFYQKYKILQTLQSITEEGVEPKIQELLQATGICDVCLYGDIGVGKTTIMDKLESLIPEERKITTDGKVTKKIRIKQTNWNTNHNLSSTEARLISAHVVFLVFDLKSQSSLEHLKIYAKILQEQNMKSTRAILVGNKLDKVHGNISRDWRQAIREFALEYSLPYVECSASSFANMYHLLYLIWSYPFDIWTHTSEMQMRLIEESINRAQKTVASLSRVD